MGSTEQASSSSSYSMDDSEFVGSKSIVKKVELVRSMIEALYSLGYKRTGACLEEESHILLYSTIVKLLLQQIIDGKWDESVATLAKVFRIRSGVIDLASLAIFEQKYFELLEGGKLMEALRTLRTQITPLCSVTHERLREFSVCILSPSQVTLTGASSQESRHLLREKLSNLLPTLIIPEKRLVTLVEQALHFQKDACRFHNPWDGEVSILANHQCERRLIPSETWQTLEEHDDEVWFLQFSHNGKYLASSSRDCVVIVWEVFLSGRLTQKLKLFDHERPVSYISWSPDDHQLLTCGADEVVRRWDVNSFFCLHKYEWIGLGTVSCAWAPDGKNIFTGLTDKSICMWDLQGRPVRHWRGQKAMGIADLGITRNGEELITICRENVILFLKRESGAERFIEEDRKIVSFSLSEDGKFLLVSLVNEKLHLWNIECHPPMRVKKYKGHKQSRFVVRSCFGGFEQGFIASGSEDSQVYIWHRASGDLIRTLAGHTGAVNCVSWNPADPHMLASAGDDCTIRIWESEV